VRFWAKVREQPNGCWLWRARGTRYPSLIVEGRKEKAHRVAWELFRGAIPEGKRVLHAPHSECGSTQCVNPAHLHLGTQRENMLDAKRDGTHNWGPVMYEYSEGMEAQIRAERAAGLGYKRIARKVGLTRDAVREVLRRRVEA
jgi:hypothetical protein